MNDAKLLTDDQVRQFITNGFLHLTPDVDPSTHVEVAALLQFAIEKESWYGNNILSRIPKMYRVLDCPVVHGALTSIAGRTTRCTRTARCTSTGRWKTATSN